MRQKKQAKRGQAKNFLIEIFGERRFPKNCIDWPFAVNEDGYGRVNWENKNSTDSRIVCEHFKGTPPRDKQVAHTCGRRRCVNPKHLRWATKEENEADKKIHGSVANMRGESNPRSKLTNSDISEIRKLRGKEFMKDTAARYGVHLSLISKIQNRQLWTSVP